MLKALFTSNVRVKLLKQFFLHPAEKFFVRQLTRDLNEQINAVRRELDSLKNIWLLKCIESNGKKYFFLNKSFVFYSELSSIMLKNFIINTDLKKELSKLWDIEYLSIAWVFVNKQSVVYLFIIWEMDAEVLQDYLNKELWDKGVNFAILNKKEFHYRLEINDSFLLSTIRDKDCLILINKLKQKLNKYV